jgi:cytochrome c-type biogenesis protein CcmH
MIAFWAMAGVISAVAATLILFRAAGAAQPIAGGRAEADDTTGVFYRRQLAEIGDLADRGLLEAGERKNAEAEAGRRLLAAADAPVETWSTASHRTAVLITAIAAPAVALGIYFAVGAPGMADQPFEGRLKQWMAANPESLTAPQMAAVLSRMAPQHPHDPEGYRFLALAEGASNNPAGAVVALKKAVRIAPQRADLWEMLGEAMIYQDGGRISDDAREAFTQTLKRDPTSVAARFNLGRARLARPAIGPAGSPTGRRCWPPCPPPISAAPRSRPRSPKPRARRHRRPLSAATR